MVLIISSGVVGTYYNYIKGVLISYPYLDNRWLWLLLALLVFGIVIAVLVSLFTVLGGWLERKMIARAQSRRGPTYVGKFGLLQNVADAIKLLSKENMMPENADKAVFPFMLPVVYALYLIALAFIPITSAFVGINVSIALLVVFMLLSFVPILLFMAGWTSGNKFGSISAQRSIAMLLSYEIPLIIVLAGIALMAHTYSLASIVSAQSHLWYIVLMPIGFVVFFIVMLAEIERPPFDLREADNELIAGWLTDVSAPYYALALFLDYTRMFVGSLLIAILFLGGWNGPVLPPAMWIGIKVVALTIVFIMIRATTVRFRLDQMLRIGWVYLLPASVINLIITFALFIR